MASDKENTKPLSLAGKLANIGEEIGKIDKTGRNSGFGGGYNFIEYSAVAGKIRTLFAKYGVIIQPEIQSYEKEVITNSRGNTGYHYVLTMKFSAINADDKDDRLESMWLGESADYGDKGINKAITAGTKYFIMRLFNISEKDDDPDGTSVEISESHTAEKKATPIDAMIAKIGTLGSIEEMENAKKAIAEKYPLISGIDKLRLEQAFKKRADQINN